MKKSMVISVGFVVLVRVTWKLDPTSHPFFFIKFWNLEGRVTVGSKDHGYAYWGFSENYRFQYWSFCFTHVWEKGENFPSVDREDSLPSDEPTGGHLWFQIETVYIYCSCINVNRWRFDRSACTVGLCACVRAYGPAKRHRFTCLLKSRFKRRITRHAWTLQSPDLPNFKFR